jgi:Fe(3+) dicitrate transport protein
LVTRDVPAARTFGLDVAGGQYLYGKLHAFGGASTEQTGFLVEGVHLRSHGFKEIDGGGDTGFGRNEWMLKARHRLGTLGPKQTLQLKLGYSDEGSNETYLGLTDADFRATPLRRYGASQFDRMDWHRTQVELSHVLDSPSFTLKTTAYRHDFDRQWRKVNSFRGADLSDVLSDPTSARNAVFFSVLSGQEDSATALEQLLIGPNHRTFVSQGIQTVARAAFLTGPIQQDLELGARLHFDSIRRMHTQDAFNVVNGAPVRLNSPTMITADNTDSTYALALHVMDALSWRALTLTPGLRVELIRSRSEDRLAGTRSNGVTNVLLPGLGAYVALHDSLGLFAGVHRGFSPPEPGQGTALPEDSINSEGGIRWMRPGHRVEVIGFFNDYSNLTDVCTFSNGCLDANLDRQYSLGRAHIYGVEAYAEKTFRPGGGFRIPLAATYTFTRTRLLDSYLSPDPQFGSVQAGDELPYVPRHEANLSAALESDFFGIAVAANYQGTMREIAGQGPRKPGEWTDDVVTFDATGSVSPTDGWKIYLTARNFLNRQAIVSRRPFGARPNAPRTVFVGLKYSY